MLKIGNSNIVGVSKGDTQFSAIYKGVDLYWSKTSIDVSDLVIEKGNEVIGDLLMYDRINQEKVIVSVSNAKLFVNNNYTPIGIFVSTSSENIFGDGKCAIMGLKVLSYLTPDKGYNGSNTNEQPYYGSTSTQVGSTWSTSTGMNDFNSLEQNNKILLYNPSYDWRTSSTINNVTSTNNYPAFYCAWRFNTEGTSQGDWYIPAAGELYKLGQNWNNFTDIFTTLLNNGVDCMNLKNIDRIYSCSEIRYDQIVSMKSGGSLSTYKKTDKCFSIPFTRI